MENHQNIAQWSSTLQKAVRLFAVNNYTTAQLFCKAGINHTADEKSIGTSITLHNRRICDAVMERLWKRGTATQKVLNRRNITLLSNNIEDYFKGLCVQVAFDILKLGWQVSHV